MILSITYELGNFMILLSILAIEKFYDFDIDLCIEEFQKFVDELF